MLSNSPSPIESSEYNKSENKHNFRLWPLGITNKTRLQLTPGGVTIIWGHIENKWHMLSIKVADFLELEEARKIAEEIIYLLEGCVLTLQKALVMWPETDIMHEYQVRFVDDRGKATAFAPDPETLIVYASERGHPITITKELHSWKIDSKDGRWHRFRGASVIEDVKLLTNLEEKLTTKKNVRGF